jgi:hypothetical protein
LDWTVVRAVTGYYETTKLKLIFLISLHGYLLGDITVPVDILNTSDVYFVPTECTYVFFTALKKKYYFSAQDLLNGFHNPHGMFHRFTVNFDSLSFFTPTYALSHTTMY